MISKKLKFIFGISIPLFIAHGIEECTTGFYNIDSHSKFLLKPFLAITDYQTSFLAFQIYFWTILILAFVLVRKLPTMFMLFIGVIYIYELHHIIKAIGVGGYYPGLVTAIGVPIIGFFFWKELIKQLRQS